MVPIEDPQLRRRLLDEVLGVALRDNTKARRLNPDGSYTRVETQGKAVRSQMALAELARAQDLPLLGMTP